MAQVRRCGLQSWKCPRSWCPTGPCGEQRDLPTMRRGESPGAMDLPGGAMLVPW